ncbi:MAG TPA: hypothetical protein VJ742_12190 [Nitrososphaera sp.]|nr:hypothetical protein [Nitrososphaera sp.]
MSNFKFDRSSYFDTQKLIDATLAEQGKEIKDVVGNKNLTTSAHKYNRADPHKLTMFSLSEILQKIPAFSGQAAVLGRFEDLFTTAINLTEGVFNTIAGGLFQNFLPDDVKESQAKFIAEHGGKRKGGEGGGGPTGTGGVDGGEALAFTPSDADVSRVVSHPKIDWEPSGVAKRYVTEKKVCAEALWLVSFIADNEPVTIISSLRPGATVANTNKPSNHAAGKAFDIRPFGKPYYGSIVGNPWNDRVYKLIDSVSGPKRPDEVLGPYLYKSPKDDSATWWGTNDDHKDHIHFGKKTWGSAPAGSIGGGGNVRHV